MSDDPTSAPHRRRMLAWLGAGTAGTRRALAVGPARLGAAVRRPRAPSPPDTADAFRKIPNAAPGKFFTPDEFALLDDLAESIIPADARSGGARAARVADYIDQRLAESIDTETRQSWKDDLDWLDELSRDLYGRRFVQQSTDQRWAFLKRCSANEAAPSKAEEFAFGTIKWEVAFVYYTSKVGVLDELGYQGNVFIDEFVGADPVSARGDAPAAEPLETKDPSGKDQGAKALDSKDRPEPSAGDKP